MDKQTISIIIPTCNEESIIASSMQKLLALTERAEGVEIIVSDASTDKTVDILEDFPVTLCNSSRGRAIQMNSGARHTNGEILYFLHADTLPPETFIHDIRSAVASGKKAGCFRMHFDDDHPLMSLFGWFTQFPLMIFRGGDQSLFITRELFATIGGFDETLLIMEDYDIISRIEPLTQFHILEAEVTTSARKYNRNGIISLQLTFGIIHLIYALGFTQESIIQYYRENVD
ncbi:MAG: TIGR04283 family arsenosugar biosynthesis glycosyltransferase [Chlorobiaceae bacterium]